MVVVGQSSVSAVDPPWIARGAQGMVATDSEHASGAGLEILQAGGNAIDAATAVSFSLAVTRGHRTGVGGGGFLIARFTDGRVVCQDFRETAPAAATADMYQKAAAANPQGPSPSEFGYLAVAVPGLAAGRCQALAQHGTMPLDRVLAPALRLAEKGFPVDEAYAAATREVLDTYEAHPKLRESCGYVWQVHLNEGRLRVAGDRLVQPELAKFFKALAAEGVDFFYRGAFADALAETMSRRGGIITKRDLADYAPKLREPLRSKYRDFELILMPPPSSGGIALTEALNVLEILDHHGVAARDAALALHDRIEAMKHVMADRAEFLGDADFVPVPVQRLTSKEFAKGLSAMIQADRVSLPREYGSLGMPKDAGTSHFCVVDRWGNVVVSTETINTTFGSLAAVDEWGVILNNEMDDFTSEPGKPNAFGLVQSSANAVAPGKKPLSSMSPTIVLRGDEPYLLIGSAGGPRIITSVLNVMLGLLDEGLSVEDAMQRIRPHHQWQPEELFFDRPPPADVAEALQGRGHKISQKRRSGTVQLILRNGKEWIGASDPRGGGKPAGE